MSSYPPPPPPPYQPPYDPRGWAREQRRAIKQQARLQRAQLKMQYRATRRRSILGPLAILGLGVVFLLVQIGKFSWPGTLGWYGRWWPVVLIGAGMVLLAEWTFDQRADAQGTPRMGRTVGGGVVFLLVLLAIAGSVSHLAVRGLEWKNNNFGMGATTWDSLFGNQHDWDDSMSAAMPAGGALIIHNPHGDVTVTGSAEDGQVHVSVHKHASVMSDSDAARKENLLQPVFSADGSNLTLNVDSVRSGRDDLTLQLPRGTPLTISADDGDIHVQTIHGAVTLSANHGGIDLSGIDGDVTAHMNNNDSSISAHSITGSVSVNGHAGDITMSDISGPVSLQGEFFGTTNLQRVNGALTFKTYRTQFTAQRLDGEFEVSNDSDLSASQVLGPVVLKTSNRDITLDRVQGSVLISNTNGPVSVLSAAPLGAIDITNHDGSVDVGVPAAASFTLNVQARDGKIQNDFGLLSKGSEDNHLLTGTVGKAGPPVTIVTREGDVTVHKSTVEPLAPAPPMAPRITTEPPTAKTPHTPKVPRTVATPKTPASPEVPAEKTF